MKGFTKILLYFYAAICLLGGVIATYKVHSWASLFTSFFLAIFVLYGTSLWEKKPQRRLLYFTLILANLFFLVRFCFKMSFFPSGMMFTLGMFCLISLWNSMRPKASLN